MGSALANVLLAAVLLTPWFAHRSADSSYIAVLDAPTGKVRWLVHAAQDRVELIPVSTNDVPLSGALQFWTKADGAPRPTSLGPVPRDRRVVISTTSLPAIGPSQLFEITLEPVGGSPVGSTAVAPAKTCDAARSSPRSWCPIKPTTFFTKHNSL